MTATTARSGGGRRSGLVAAAAERAAREREVRRRHGTPLIPGPASVDDELAAGPPSPDPPEPEPEPAHREPPAGRHGLGGLRDFLARRLTGRYDVDEFGMDRDLAESVVLPALRTLYSGWFRTDVRGAENVPDSGAALLVSNHSGTLPWDALMLQVAVHDVTPSRRLLRPLAADLVLRTPLVADLARRSGATLATSADAERLLAGGELVGVWPEGFKGLGKLYRDRYRLQRFGRGGFVSAAVRAGVPIIPVAVVGAEEAHPMIADIEPLARLFGVPYWPVTPTWPWLGPLGLVPLPSRWTIEFGVPVPTDRHSPADADDPLLVLELTDHVREVIQRTLYTLLVQRGTPPG
ncbi:MAG: lysophospholipid acyltransferase family protein [Kineosporiaceae bacterium]